MKLLGGWPIVDRLGRVRFPYAAPRRMSWGVHLVVVGSNPTPTQCERARRGRPADRAPLHRLSSSRFMGPMLDWASAPLAAEIMRVRIPSVPLTVRGLRPPTPPKSRYLSLRGASPPFAAGSRGAARTRERRPPGRVSDHKEPFALPVDAARSIRWRRCSAGGPDERSRPAAGSGERPGREESARCRFTGSGPARRSSSRHDDVARLLDTTTI